VSPNRVGLMVGVMAAALMGPAQADDSVAAGRYRLDPQHTFVHFEVLHFGTSTIRGRLGPVDGEIVLDPARGSGEVGLRVATASVDMGFPFFNTRMRAADLLASADHPEAYFVANRFRFEQGRLVELGGEFTLRGVGRSLTLKALRSRCRVDAQGQVCGGDFEGEIQRSDFGIDFGLPFIADRVRLQVQVEGRRLDPPR
jgi:polyisoprenoid-binding protein YceI